MIIALDKVLFSSSLEMITGNFIKNRQKNKAQMTKTTPNQPERQLTSRESQT